MTPRNRISAEIAAESLTRNLHHLSACTEAYMRPIYEEQIGHYFVKLAEALGYDAKLRAEIEGAG